MTATTQRPSGLVAVAGDGDVDIALSAFELGALLRLLAKAHENLSNFEVQSDVGWLLPVAARMADEIARVAHER